MCASKVAEGNERGWIIPIGGAFAVQPAVVMRRKASRGGHNR